MRGVPRDSAPRMTPCGHVFCAVCIVWYYRPGSLRERRGVPRAVSSVCDAGHLSPSVHHRCCFVERPLSSCAWGQGGPRRGRCPYRPRGFCAGTLIVRRAVPLKTPRRAAPPSASTGLVTGPITVEGLHLRHTPRGKLPLGISGTSVSATGNKWYIRKCHWE